MITEDYVSFKTAKLLKENGFNEKTYRCYNLCTEEHELSDIDDIALNNWELDNDGVSAPTLQMAMKWLREKGLYINVWADCRDAEHNDFSIVYRMMVFDGVSNHGTYEFPTYEVACEAAIKYCLKNLIKNDEEAEESDIPVPKTIDEAISTLEKILSDEDREYLLKNGAISMHDSLGRWIRNEWGLWTDSGLKNELKKKGFVHPDDMSNYIIEEFIKYWNNKEIAE